MREVVEVIRGVEGPQVVAGAVELGDHEDLGGVLSTPVAHDDRSVTGKHGKRPRRNTVEGRTDKHEKW